MKYIMYVNHMSKAWRKLSKKMKSKCESCRGSNIELGRRRKTIVWIKKGEKSVKGCHSGNCIFPCDCRSGEPIGSIERKVNLLVYSRYSIWTFYSALCGTYETGIAPQLFRQLSDSSSKIATITFIENAI